MAMAGCGLRYGQGPFGGDSVGRNPTDRGKAGSKEASWLTGVEGH